MNSSDFDFLAKFVKDKSGIVLSSDKGYLIESRLTPIARQNGCDTLDQLVGKLRGMPRGALAESVVDAMTTNESFFFRDKTPFDHLENVILPDFKESRAKDRSINFWCAAASSGQEPYSIAMILKEWESKLPSWNTGILGTDISPTILDRAKAGNYSQFEVQRGLPIQMLVKYFSQKGEQWSVNPKIKSMVRYKQWNLLEPFTSLGKFDVVFCRNVLIYFDQQTKSEVLGRISNVMKNDGVLYLGGAETVLGITDKFVPITGHRGMYAIAGGEPALKTA